jgi:ATP-dependent 26S proteasome regulatory subunit
MSFVRATRYDERLQVEKLAQRERKNIITQIAKNVAELHDVDADELIKVAAHQMA